MKLLLPRLTAISLLAFGLHAQNAVPPGDTGDPFVKRGGDAAGKEEENWQQCAITFEAYALDKEEAAALLEAERGSSGRYRRLLELTKAGKARLEILEGLTTKSGQRAVIESIDETRYPTEFTPPEVARGIAVPTAWETRNVGDTFEVEPVIGPDGRTCDLNLVPQRVRLVEFRDLPEMPGVLQTSQPIFSAQKLTTSASLLEGEPHYLGTITPQTSQGIAKGGAPSEVWLAFLHVSVQRLPPPKAKAPQQANAPAANLDSIELQYSCYSLDRAAAREILVGGASMSAPWEKVKALIAEKKARLEHFTTINTKSGQRSVTEEIHEVRFMSEYAGEHRLGTSETTHRTVTKENGEKKPGPNPEAGANPTSTETTTTTRTDANSILIPGQASAFETHNIGVTVEVEPVLAPSGLLVDLNHAIQSVKLAGNLKVTGIATNYPPVPLFEDAKVTSSEFVPVDLPVLVSTLNPPPADGVNDRVDNGRTYLLFVRASVGEH